MSAIPTCQTEQQIRNFLESMNHNRRFMAASCSKMHIEKVYGTFVLLASQGETFWKEGEGQTPRTAFLDAIEKSEWIEASLNYAGYCI